MTRIVGLSGSLRQGSYNTSLLHAAKALAPASVEVQIHGIDSIPLYNADVESLGIPKAVTELKDAIAEADGLLWVTPEYNGSLPGVFKNAIDWCSRPGEDMQRVFGQKPTAIMGATPGMGGTRLSQTAWLPVMRGLGVRPWLDRQLYVSGAGKVFDAQGKLVDSKVAELLLAFMKDFAAFVMKP